jgi:hypothetical protein
MTMPQRSARVPAQTTPARQLAGFIAKFDPAVGKVIRGARRALRRRVPTAIEIVYDNYNFFVIGYSTTERPSDCMFSIAAAANGLGLSFYYGSTLPDPDGLLLGSGKQNRFIRLPSTSVLESAPVERLLSAAIAQSRRPLAAKGGGYTIIKSVSAKQRARRRSNRSRTPKSKGQ